MLGVASTSSSSSSLSSKSSASETVPASPPPIPDLLISSATIVAGSVLPIILEMPELDVAQHTLEPEGMRPCIGTSTAMLLNDPLFILADSRGIYILDKGDGGTS
jgi:hypothetical protein